MDNSSIIVEGGMFPSDLLDRVATGDVDGQRAPDFGLNRSRQLTSEIQAAFSDSRSYWDSFQRRLNRSSESRTTLTRQDWMHKLIETMGYEPLTLRRRSLEAGGQSYSIYASVGEIEDAPPFHVVAIDRSLDRREGRRSPHSTVQEYLNNSDALWGVVSNGSRIRLLRDSARVTRPTYIEFDVRGMVESNQYADFAAMYRLLHRTRLPSDATPPEECLLERYYQQGIDDHSRVRDRLRVGVEQALAELGNGFLAHENSSDLRELFRSGSMDAERYYRQLLRLVYRLLFLMVAEERRLLYPSDSGGDIALHRVYERHYSVSRLRERAERRWASGHARESDIWEGLKQTFLLFRDDSTASNLGMSALDGELFSRTACQELEQARLDNRSMLSAIRNLSTFWDEGGVRRSVNYAGIDTEEFGSVYESLLELHPRVELSPRPSFQFLTGTERKETGSYYTPPELTRELVDSALVPVMRDRMARVKTDGEKEAALLGMKVCDPAAGSGHFLLAAARRIAREVARLRSGETEPTPSDYRAAMRDVIRNCIYAVDKNPLAVDLCKVALWIEGHEPGLPLSFLDYRVKNGDSLVGVMDMDTLDAGIPDGAYKAIGDDDKSVVTALRRRNRTERGGGIQYTLDSPNTPDDVLRETAQKYQALTHAPEANARDVREKSDSYNATRGKDTDWFKTKVACDLWTAAFFLPRKTTQEYTEDSTPTTGMIRKWMAHKDVYGPLTGRVCQMAAVSRFFHWPLEFPEVFEDDGGFDVVLGNPPWDVIQPEDLKFFGIYDQNIADLPGATRKRAIAALPQSDPTLAVLWSDHKREIESMSNYARSSERFPLGSRGKVNTYAVFTELATSLVKPTGCAGIIVPTGISTDNNTSGLFNSLVNSRSLASLYDFENREKVFPGIDSRIKFCLLTMNGSERPIEEAEFAFFLTQTNQLRDDSRRFVLTADDFALFNPNTRNCPIFRTERDMEIARKMYRRAGVLIDESDDDGNPWGVSLSTMFNMTSDSSLFRTRVQLEEAGWLLNGNIFEKDADRYLPLYEGKMFHQYDHRFSTFEGVGERAVRRGNPRSMMPEEKADPASAVIPRYWIPEKEVEEILDKQEEMNTTLSPTDRPTSKSSQNWRASRYQEICASHGRKNRNTGGDTRIRTRRLGDHNRYWLIVFRDVARSTDQRTSIFSALEGTGMNHKAPMLNTDSTKWLQMFRDITNSTNQRTMITSHTAANPAGHKAPLLNYQHSRAVASALALANMNSIPFDWAARLSVGGTNMSFFIIKQLPVLRPEAYLEESPTGVKYVEMVVPRVLELTYTSHELEGFALDLGYDGPPFTWDEERRHRLRCELDAIFAQMYGLERDELEWILDAPSPSASFPTLKRNEISQFGEYRTQRYVLQAYDQMLRGEPPDLSE